MGRLWLNGGNERRQPKRARKSNLSFANPAPTQYPPAAGQLQASVVGGGLFLARKMRAIFWG